MDVMWIGIPVRVDRESASRTSWPPPSSVVPSMWTGGGELLEGSILFAVLTLQELWLMVKFWALPMYCECSCCLV